MLNTVRQDWFFFILAAVVLISAILHQVISVFLGHPQPTLYALAGSGATGLTIFVFLFSKWLWKWSFWHRIGLVTFPDLTGTWSGHLVSGIANNPQSKLPLECVIKQDAWSISWKAWTAHSENRSISATLFKDEVHDDIKLAIVYENLVKHGAAAAYSADHRGATILELRTDNTRTLALIGSYWTNKKVGAQFGTTGTFDLQRV